MQLGYLLGRELMVGIQLLGCLIGVENIMKGLLGMEYIVFFLLFLVFLVLFGCWR